MPELIVPWPDHADLIVNASKKQEEALLLWYLRDLLQAHEAFAYKRAAKLDEL